MSKRERLWSEIAARSHAAAPDLALLHRWRAGERAAGAELCRRHLGRLRGFFASMCGGDAGELARRTLLAGAADDAPVGQAGFRAYLFALARRELHRYLRRRGGDEQIDLSIVSVAEIMRAGRGRGERP